MARVEGAEPAYKAAEKWRDQCLLDQGSVLTDKSLWTSENFRHLVRYFVENLDYGKGREAPDPARQTIDRYRGNFRSDYRSGSLSGRRSR